jgi:hypothetical protein
VPVREPRVGVIGGGDFLSLRDGAFHFAALVDRPQLGVGIALERLAGRDAGAVGQAVAPPGPLPDLGEAPFVPRESSRTMPLLECGVTWRTHHTNASTQLHRSRHMSAV